MMVTVRDMVILYFSAEYLYRRAGHVDVAIVRPFHLKIAAGQVIKNPFFRQSVQYACCSHRAGTGAARQSFTGAPFPGALTDFRA